MHFLRKENHLKIFWSEIWAEMIFDLRWLPLLFAEISNGKNKKKTRMNCFRYLKLMSPLNAAICTITYLERQKCYGPGKKILFKKQLFDLEVKVPWRSLHYVTHHLMVMHPHAKYNWPIWKDKKVMVQTSFAEKKRKQKKRKKKSD